MSCEKASVLMTCPLVGEGNPAMMFAQQRLFLNDGISVDASMLTFSAVLAKAFHKRMSGSSQLSKSYSEGGEGLRRMAKYVLGVPMAAELALRNQPISTPGSAHNFLIGTQEHQYGAFSKEFLAEKFPQGRILVVGDVEPKQSAIDIARNKDIRLAVWNLQAFAKLIDLGIDPLLIAPSLPLGFSPENVLKVKKGEHVLIKSSGSGIPDLYVAKLKAALDELGFPYKFFLPDKVVTDTGSYKRPRSLKDKILGYYQEVLENPSALTITYPSEQVQSEASLGRMFLSLPPRGQHEVTNLQWAKKHGVLLDTLDPEDDKDLSGKIFEMYFVARTSVAAADVDAELGKMHLSKQLFPKDALNSSPVLEAVPVL